jgi:hypothetical protein
MPDVQDEIFARFREAYLIGDRKNDIAASVTADIVEDIAKKFPELFQENADASKDKNIFVLIGVATLFEGRIRKDLTPKIKEETAKELRAEIEIDVTNKIAESFEKIRNEEKKERDQEIIRVVNIVRNEAVKFFFASTALVFGIEGLHYMDAISASLPASAGTVISAASILGIMGGGGYSVIKLIKAVRGRPEDAASLISKADIKRGAKVAPTPTSTPDIVPTPVLAEQIASTKEFAANGQRLTKSIEDANAGGARAVSTKKAVATAWAANTNLSNAPKPKDFIRISPDVPQRPEDKIRVFLENTLHA